SPLSAILGWSAVLKRSIGTEADLKKGLDTIERNARAQTQLIEDLLDMSRITSGKVRLDMQPVEPASFIEAAVETIRPAAEAKGITLEMALDHGAGTISGDPHRLQQVIGNLMSNAVKFTPKGGRIRIALQRIGTDIEVSVADTGSGIKPEFLPYVFERFRQADASTTRRYGGLGLGLAIVRHLVELHGGSVQATSPGEGQGATFAIKLPVVQPVTNTYKSVPAPAGPIPAIAAPLFRTLDLAGIRVLVVDDDADVRELIRRILSDCDATVLSAGNAMEALRIVETQQPHLMVSDIGMPDVDGFELLRRIRALGQAGGGRLPAIALTAFARSEDRTRALRAGFLAHVAKPVEPSELVATVASVAGRANEAH
ncbi:MAG: ATP-binding protein, partial [Betaproteobacteria bacterium]